MQFLLLDGGENINELEKLLNLVNDYKIIKQKEMTEAAKTIENWLLYILNSFIDKGFSNRFAEGLNNKIKVVKRVAFGYKNFKFFRLRLMHILNGKISGMSKKDRNRKKWSLSAVKKW